MGLPPAGVVQVILNFPGVGAGRAVPLKMVAQLLADPGMLNVSVPAMLPSAMVPAVVTHGLPVLPREAFTTIFSVFAVPPFMSGGEKAMIPLQTPSDGLHVTCPGRLTGKVAAVATLDTTESDANESSVAVETKRRIFRGIRAPAFT